MTKRIAAIAFIFVCTSAAWGILGATMFARTYSSDSSLRGRVQSSWGAPQVQRPPVASWTDCIRKTVEKVEDGKKVVSTTAESVSRRLPLEASDITADLHLDYRQKGLLWYSTYQVGFSGSYTFRNDTAARQWVTFTLELPAAQTIYDNLEMSVGDQLLEISNSGGKAYARAYLPPSGSDVLRVRYRSQGVDSWAYNFGSEISQVRNFRLRVLTDFRGMDFAENTLSPTGKRETPAGWDLTWAYTNLLSGYQIGIRMPEKLQPGPLAGRISLFAPVSLLFFFFLLFVIATLRRVDLHPMNYFFLAAAFFSFHLLLAYLVDHVSIHAAFVISAATSIVLVVSYLRLVVGLRFALVEAGLMQICYLVLFSYAFFFEGYTGLAITIGAVMTLFVVMQLTGRIRWSERFSSPRPGLERA